MDRSGSLKPCRLVYLTCPLNARLIYCKNRAAASGVAEGYEARESKFGNIENIGKA
jgi:hypothetical protein